MRMSITACTGYIHNVIYTYMPHCLLLAEMSRALPIMARADINTVMSPDFAVPSVSMSYKYFGAKMCV